MAVFELAVRCDTCGGTFLHTPGCINFGKLFVKPTEVDVAEAETPKFREHLAWQQIQRHGKTVVPVV